MGVGVVGADAYCFGVTGRLVRQRESSIKWRQSQRCPKARGVETVSVTHGGNQSCKSGIDSI